jgi:hypothetical protein
VTTAIAILLAVASALAFAVSTVGQQRVAAETSDRDARNGRFFLQLLRNPRWIAATGGGAVGYGLQGAALGVGTVLVVAPVLVTSLLFALPLSAHFARERLPVAAMRSGLLLTASLAIFEVLGHTGTGLRQASAVDWLIASAVGGPVVAGCLVLARVRSGTARAGLLAVAVGVLGGVLAVLTKSVVDTAAGGILAVVGSGDTYALVGVGLTGIYLQQLAFQAGNLRASLPVMTVLEPLTATALGVTLLHEHVQLGVLRVAALIVCALLATVATITLAGLQAQSLRTQTAGARPIGPTGAGEPALDYAKPTTSCGVYGAVNRPISSPVRSRSTAAAASSK